MSAKSDLDASYSGSHLPTGYDAPDGCVAVVAVGTDGSYVMLEKPNLWMFDVEPSPQNNGFGDDLDLPPGVYRITYTFRQHTDWETGQEDDWEFEPYQVDLLWSPVSWWRQLVHNIRRRFLD